MVHEDYMNYMNEKMVVGCSYEVSDVFFHGDISEYFFDHDNTGRSLPENTIRSGVVLFVIDVDVPFGIIDVDGSTSETLECMHTRYTFLAPSGLIIGSYGHQLRSMRIKKITR